MRTLAAITLTKAARASKSTASFPACETSDTPFKSPRCRQPHDRRYRPIHPSQLGQRSTHRPPDGGQTARSRRLCFYLDPWRELIAFVRSTSTAKVQFDLIESTLGRKL